MNRFEPGARIRQGHRAGRVVMPWVGGKWAVQMNGDPRGSYTLLHACQMELVGEASA